MSSTVNPTQDEEERVLVAVYPRQKDIMVLQVPKRACISDLEKCLAQQYHAVFPEKGFGKTNPIRILKCIPTVESVENRYALMFPELKSFTDPNQHATCFVDLAKNVQVGNAFVHMERIYVIQEDREIDLQTHEKKENKTEGHRLLADPAVKSKKRPSTEPAAAPVTPEAEANIMENTNVVATQPKKKARISKEKTKASKETTDAAKVKKQLAVKKKDAEESVQKPPLDKKKKSKAAKEIKLDASGAKEKQTSSEDVIPSSISPEVTEIEESPPKAVKKKLARRTKDVLGPKTKATSPSITTKPAADDDNDKSDEKSSEPSKPTTTLASKPKAMKRGFQDILLAAQERIARDKLQILQDASSPSPEKVNALPEKTQSTNQPADGSDSESSSDGDNRPVLEKKKQEPPSSSSSTETSEDEFNYSQNLLADLTKGAEEKAPVPIVSSNTVPKPTKTSKTNKNREQKIQEEMELLSKNLRKLQKAQAESADSVLSPPLSKNQFSLDQVAVGKLTRSAKNPFSSTTEPKVAKVPRSRAKK